MKYKEVREEIMSFVERKRDLFGTQLKAMEVDNYEEMGDQVWWGGSEPWCGDGWDVSSGGDVRLLEKRSLAGKGFERKRRRKGKKKGCGKKGGSKGNGKDNKVKGKGKGGGFQGSCHWCGEWGHSQSRCRHKDEYMNEIRRTKGQERNGYQANSMEDVKPGDTRELQLENTVTLRKIGLDHWWKMTRKTRKHLSRRN